MTWILVVIFVFCPLLIAVGWGIAKWRERTYARRLQAELDDEP